MKPWTITVPSSQNDLQAGNGGTVEQEILVGDGWVGGERARIRAPLCLIGSRPVVCESKDGIIRYARDPADDLASSRTDGEAPHLKVVVLRPSKKVFPKRRPLELSCLYARMVKMALKPSWAN